MKGTRRAMLAASAAALLLPPAALAGAGHGALPAAQSLQRELQAALQSQRVLVALASLDGCPACRIVRGHYLASLHANGQPVVQLELGQSLPLADFGGAATTHGAVLRALGVRSAPTVLFFGRGGREVAPRLVGLSGDFYAAYLEERLETARRSLA